MVQNKKNICSLISVFDPYCKNNGLDIVDKIFIDNNGRECRLNHSSVATYEGLWIGDKQYNSMHMNIPKTKRILEKMKLYLTQSSLCEII